MHALVEYMSPQDNFPISLEDVRGEIRDIFALDQKRMERLVENRPKIEDLANQISSGQVIVADFGPVVGYICNGASTKAINQINTFKQMESHTFALVTTPTAFPLLIDAQQTPSSFLKRAQDQTLPQGIHYRVPAKVTVNCGEKQVLLPDLCRSIGEDGIPMIQIAIFGDESSPELAYLVQTLWVKHQIPHVIATSANIHGQTELSVYRTGEALASERHLPFLNIGPDPTAHEIPGSYGGIRVSAESSHHALEDVIHLFRHGHLDTPHLSHLLGMPIQLDPDVSPPRFPYPAIDEEALQWVFSQPARLRLQLLRAIVEKQAPKA